MPAAEPGQAAPYAAVVAGLFRLAFFVPLLACTYLALVPEPPDNPVFRLGDVVLHGAAFSYLTFTLYLLILNAGHRTMFSAIGLRVVAAMLGYGIFLEAVQSFVPERSAELKDLLVDTAGIGVGLMLAALIAEPVCRLIRSAVAWLAGYRNR